MRSFLILVAIFTAASVTASAQQFTLEQLVRAALNHHPSTAKLSSEHDLMLVKKDGIRAAFLPDLSMNAQIGYQSMVPELPFQMPGAPRPNIPKDRYQASLDVSQLIYDGGVTNERLAMMELESELSQTRFLAERFPIQQQVVDAWYGLEFVSVQRNVLRLTLEDLEARHRLLEVGHEEGVVMRVDVDRIAVELERVRQKDAQIHADSIWLVDILAEITGLTFPVGSIFHNHDLSQHSDQVVIRRPELQILELSSDLADAKLDFERAMRRPKVNGYVQGAYGKPGLDIFADSFSPFWQAGIRASWPLWDKGASKRDHEVNRLVKSQIDDDRALFDRSIRLAIERQETEIQKNRALLEGDESIIALQERIKLASEAKLDEGIINATDYLQDVRAVEQARIQYESRKISIRYAQAQISIIRGGI